MSIRQRLCRCEIDGAARLDIADSKCKIVFRTEEQELAGKLAAQIISRDRALYLSSSSRWWRLSYPGKNAVIELTKEIQTLPAGVAYLIPFKDQIPALKVSVSDDGQIKIIG